MSELVPVNIVIADRTYRVKVSPVDEESVLKSAALVNEKILAFKNQFAGKDLQDYIAMVLIWFVSEQANPTEHPMVWEDLSQKLADLNDLVDQMLAEK